MSNVPGVPVKSSVTYIIRYCIPQRTIFKWNVLWITNDRVWLDMLASRKRVKKRFKFRGSGNAFSMHRILCNTLKVNLEKNGIICLTFLDTDMLSQIWLSLVCWLLRCCSSQRSWVFFKESWTKNNEV